MERSAEDWGQAYQWGRGIQVNGLYMQKMWLYGTASRDISGAGVDMRFVASLTDFKIDDPPLPEGYSMRRMRNTAEDRLIWDALQAHFRHTKFTEGERNTAVFVFHGDEPVGALGMLVWEGEGLFTAGIVLEGHRRQGLFNAMMMAGLRYYQEIGVKVVRFAIREFLDEWGRRVFKGDV